MVTNINSMIAHQSWMDVDANNVANVNTQDFTADDTKIESNLKVDISDTKQPTKLEVELTDHIPITVGFDAQAKVITTYDEILGTVLNIKG